MLSFTIGQVFVPSVYIPIQQAQKKFDKKAEEKLKKNFIHYAKAKPEVFDVDRKYCLNEKTVDYFNDNY